MNTRNRPTQAVVFSILLAASAAIMIYMGTMASAYYAPSVCLIVEALLLWQGKAQKLFKNLLLLNQVTAVVLILDLWLGDALHLPKLDISGVMLIGNMVSGGPLLGILAVPLLASLYFSKTLPQWFNAGHA
jgi:hypothetical protein